MINKARFIAMKVLFEINEKKAYSNIAIQRNIDKSISSLDESLVRELVYGVIENKIYIDWVINQFSKIKFNRISPKIREILRIGVYQIIFMDKIPDSAACNEAVNIVKKVSHKGAVGYVNGILRNISRKKQEIKLPKKHDDVVNYLSIKYSHPIWMVNRWIKEFGEEFTENLCRANNLSPRLNIRVNTLKIDREELIKILRNKNLVVEKTRYSHDGIIITNPKRITELNEFRDGYFTIQDESSMLVAQIMNPLEGSRVIDLCSAPGGKTTHIAQKMNNKGLIIARDIYNHKLKLVENNCERLGIDIIKTQNFDALKFDKDLEGKMDYCLVDVPCTGLGLIRRKPEIKWNKKEEDIKNIVEIQYKILENGSKYLRQGGILIYSTCTIEKHENIQNVNRFLQNNKKFKLLPFDDIVDIKTYIKEYKEGYIQLFSNIHKTDGFFIAKMIKI